jgi:hypothetical protein
MNVFPSHTHTSCFRVAAMHKLQLSRLEQVFGQLNCMFSNVISVMVKRRFIPKTLNPISFICKSRVTPLPDSFRWDNTQATMALHRRQTIWVMAFLLWQQFPYGWCAFNEARFREVVAKMERDVNELAQHKSSGCICRNDARHSSIAPSAIITTASRPCPPPLPRVKVVRISIYFFVATAAPATVATTTTNPRFDCPRPILPEPTRILKIRVLLNRYAFREDSMPGFKKNGPEMPRIGATWATRRAPSTLAVSRVPFAFIPLVPPTIAITILAFDRGILLQAAVPKMSSWSWTFPAR